MFGAFYEFDAHSDDVFVSLSPEQGGPKIIDFVHPDCENLGPCDMEA